MFAASAARLSPRTARAMTTSSPAGRRASCAAPIAPSPTRRRSRPPAAAATAPAIRTSFGVGGEALGRALFAAQHPQLARGRRPVDARAIGRERERVDCRLGQRAHAGRWRRRWWRRVGRWPGAGDLLHRVHRARRQSADRCHRPPQPNPHANKVTTVAAAGGTWETVRAIPMPRSWLAPLRRGRLRCAAPRRPPRRGAPTPATQPGRDLALPAETHLANLRQLTFGGENAEAYWSFDGDAADPAGARRRARRAIGSTGMPLDRRRARGGVRRCVPVSSGKGARPARTSSRATRRSSTRRRSWRRRRARRAPTQPGLRLGAVRSYDIFRAGADGANARG